MAIAKTASRNVAFKVAKMREAIMEFLVRKSEHEEAGLETNNWAMLELEDVGQNADQICILPIKKATRKLRRLASAGL